MASYDVAASSARPYVEVQFYNLLDRMMPYYAREQIGVDLLKRAVITGTTPALQAAVAQARSLVFEMGSSGIAAGPARCCSPRNAPHLRPSCFEGIK